MKADKELLKVRVSILGDNLTVIINKTRLYFVILSGFKIFTQATKRVGRKKLKIQCTCPPICYWFYQLYYFYHLYLLAINIVSMALKCLQPDRYIN